MKMKKSCIFNMLNINDVSVFCKKKLNFFSKNETFCIKNQYKQSIKNVKKINFFLFVNNFFSYFTFFFKSRIFYNRIRMIRILLIFLCGFITVFEIVGQQDPQYSQYMFNQFAVNPGSAGSNEAICINGVHRSQWVGITDVNSGLKGHPVTYAFTVNAPFTINVKEKATLHGFGVTVMSDQIGFTQNISAGLSYAYRMNLGFGDNAGRLGIGVSGMVLNNAFNAQWHTPNGRWEEDPNIPAENASDVGFDMGFGIFYRAERVYVGVSATHLFEPTLSYERANYRMRRHYYATAGCTLPLQNPAWEASPSLMAYSDMVSTQFTANINFIYNKRVWGGVGYRLNDAIIAMIGFDLFNGVKIGYSFDYTYTNLRNSFTLGGSHEIVVGYCFNLIRDKVVRKYKSVRFL